MACPTPLTLLDEEPQQATDTAPPPRSPNWELAPKALDAENDRYCPVDLAEVEMLFTLANEDANVPEALTLSICPFVSNNFDAEAPNEAEDRSATSIILIATILFPYKC